jgi:hypothetical protein
MSDFYTLERVCSVGRDCSVVEGPQLELEREITANFSMLETQLQTKLFVQVSSRTSYTTSTTMPLLANKDFHTSCCAFLENKRIS